MPRDIRKRVEAGRIGLYAAQLNEYGPIRIAFSWDIPMRIKRIQADCPSGLVKLLAMKRAHFAEEIVVREELADYAHAYGKDWYKCRPEVFRFIEGWNRYG